MAFTTGGVEVTVTEMNLPVAHSTLVQLLRRNAVVIQVVFALLWPLVATTIGLFLIGFGRPLQLRTVSRIGAAATLATLALPLVAMGPALIALTATSMIAALLASAWCCAVAARLHTAFTLGQRG